MIINKYLHIRKNDHWRHVKSKIWLSCLPLNLSCVYAILDGRNIIYIGTTQCLVIRMRCNKKFKSWHSLYYIQVNNKKQRLALELRLIRFFKPKLNIQGMGKDGFLKEALLEDLKG